MTNSTITANADNQSGTGGLAGVPVTVTNSTVTNNTDVGINVLGLTGGTGVLTLVYSTVTGNTGANLAESGGQGHLPETLIMFGSVVALPESGGIGTRSNCGPGFTTTTSHGFNFTDDSTCGLPAGETHVGVSPGRPGRVSEQRWTDPDPAPTNRQPVDRRHPQRRVLSQTAPRRRGSPPTSVACPAPTPSVPTATSAPSRCRHPCRLR